MASQKNRSWLSKLFAGGDEVSVKRVIGMASFIILCYFGFFILHSSETIANELTVKYFMEVLFMIICVTLLGGSIENIFKARFASQQSSNETPANSDVSANQEGQEEGNVTPQSKL